MSHVSVQYVCQRKFFKNVSCCTCLALAMIGGATTARGGYSDVVLQEGPVSYWRLNESAGATTAADVMGKASGTYMKFPDTATGDMGLGKEGPRPSGYDGFDLGNTAAHFSPTTNNYVTMGDDADLDVTGDLTLETWVKADSYSGVRGLLSKYGAARSYLLYVNGNKLTMVISADGNFNSNYQLASTNALVSGRWYHLAGVFDADGGSDGGGSLTLYINGKLDHVKTTGLPTALYNSGTAFQLGTYGGSQFLDGYMDEAAVYNKALSAARIREHYFAGRVVFCPYTRAVLEDNPVSYWQLNQAFTNEVAADVMGAADGTFINFPEPSTSVAGLGSSGPGMPLFSGFKTGNLAPHFAPTNYVDGSTTSTVVTAGTPAVLQITNALTVEAWINIDQIPALANPAYNYGIAGKYDVLGGNWRAYQLSLVNAGSSGQARLQMTISNTGSYSAANQLNSTRLFISSDVGKWFHLAVVFDPAGGSDGGGALRIYINGQLDSEKTTGVSTSIVSNNAPFLIGKQFNNDPRNAFDGFIDEVAVYNSALTSGRINAHYLARVSRATLVQFF